MITDLGGTAGKNKKDSLIIFHYLMKSLHYGEYFLLSNKAHAIF